MSAPGVGKRIELTIDSLAAGGDGVARHDGRVIFVPHSAPGDRLRVELVQSRSRFGRAEIVEVLEPGPGRRAPPCPQAGRCGGCDWLHLQESQQTQARRRIVEDALRRIGGLEVLPAIEVIEAPAPLRYRSRARVAYDAGRVGFRSTRSHEVVDVAHCAVLDDATQAALDALRADPPSGRGEIEIRGFGEDLRVGRFEYHVSPGSFFQANRPLWETWIATVLDACDRGALAVELYAGVGFYTVGLVERFERVVAVEWSGAARDLVQNARAQVVRSSVEAFASASLTGLAPDLVLVNPPREGCDVSVMEAIATMQSSRVVYVSCEPATLARDLSRLDGLYGVEKLVVMDALPQTSQVEVICSLELVDTSSNAFLQCSSVGG